ncbi:MAG: S8 family serine peptidase, partial [Ignavibacteria bacterium]
MLQRISIILSMFTMILFAQSVPNDPLFQYQWNLTKISAPAAWTISTGSPSIIIAIVDQGVESAHPDLLNKLVTGYDVESDDNTTEPYPNLAISYHGTASAGVAAALTNNGIGIAGVGYNCKIMPIQVSHDRYWDSDNFATAIIWASDHGADIISISGKTDEDPDVISAIDYATSNGRSGKGCIIVTSAGNTGKSDPPYSELQFPAKYSKVLSVGASNPNDQKVDESSVGPELDVVAPSVVYATDLTGTDGEASGDYMTDYDGTSSATPHVAGLAGLMLSVNNNLTEEEVRTIICFTADDIALSGFDEGTGWGRINAYNAVRSADRQFTLNGTMQEDEFWWGNITLNNNVTVPSGVRLIIHSGANVNLNGYSIIADGGTITNNGTISGLKAKVYSSELKGICGTLQAAIDFASAQESIVVSEGTINEDISIVGKTNLSIRDVELNGDISMTNSDHIVLQDNTCNNIYISNCDYPWIWSVVVEGSGSGNGVSMYNVAHLSQYGNSSITVDNFENGLYAISTTFGMENLIKSAFTRVDNGVVGYANANITLNSVELCSVSDYHLISSYGSYIYANGCYYNGGTPIIQESGGTVETVSNQSCASLSKRNTSEEIMTAYSTDEFEKINNQLRELSKRISSEMDEIGKFNARDYKDEILDIADLYTQYAANTESKYRGAAITTAVHCYKGIEEYEAMKAFLEELENESEIGGYAKRYMIDYYQEQNDFDKALSIADELLEEEKADIDLTNTVLYAKGLLLAHDMNKPEAAAECFSILLQKTTNEGFIALAQNELRILGYEESVKKEDSETVLADEEELSISNYPNPFNPTTTI